MTFVDIWQNFLSVPFHKRGGEFLLNLSPLFQCQHFITISYSPFSLNLSLWPFPLPCEFLIQCQLFENSFQIPFVNPCKRTCRTLEIQSIEVGLSYNCFFMLYQPGSIISSLSNL